MSRRPIALPYVEDSASTSMTASASGRRSPLVPVLSVTTEARFSAGPSAALARGGEKVGSGLSGTRAAGVRGGTGPPVYLKDDWISRVWVRARVASCHAAVRANCRIEGGESAVVGARAAVRRRARLCAVTARLS